MPIYIKFDGIDGEATAKGFEKWVEVLSFSWGVTNSGAAATGGGAGAGKASFQDLHIQSTFQSSSPQLFASAASGKSISTAQIAFVKGGDNPDTYLTIKMNDVIISSYSSAGAEGADSDVPSDDVGISFAKIEVQYQQQSADGSVVSPIGSTWDLTTNAGG
jgi:type VI secretion system secreted protein Hcp